MPRRRLPSLSRRLKELGFKTYQDYLASDHWRNVRRLWMPRRTRNDSPVCEFCLAGQRPLHLHHRIYKNLGRETSRDLVLICESCHDWVHTWFNNGRKSLWTTTRQVQRKAIRQRRCV